MKENISAMVVFLVLLLAAGIVLSGGRWVAAMSLPRRLETQTLTS